MTKWIAIYAVADACYVLTMESESFTDAATMTDSLSSALRTAKITPELLQVYGPYARVSADLIVAPILFRPRLQEIDEAIALLEAARARMRERLERQDPF